MGIPAIRVWVFCADLFSESDCPMGKGCNEMRLFLFTIVFFDVSMNTVSKAYRVDFIKFSLLYAGQKHKGFFPVSLLGFRKVSVWYYIEICFISFCLNPWRNPYESNP